MGLDEKTALENVKIRAKIRHEKARKAAAKRGRKDFPMLPYECSWAFEQEFHRQFQAAQLEKRYHNFFSR